MLSYNTKIGSFCATNKDWQEILSAEPYCLKIKEDTDYIIFNYDQIRSDFNNPIVQEARGIIFKKDNWTYPVCWAFNKFGNYGESYAPEINWDTAFVTEKIDGSLIKVWYDDTWHISTNGTIDAFKAELGGVKFESFGDYFLDTLAIYTPPYIFRDCFTEFTYQLNEEYTYMFELVGPYNRVVIPYEEARLYFLGARNKYTGEERFCTEAEKKDLGVAVTFHKPVRYSLSSLEDCIKVTENFGWDQEGFVVADANFNRIKVKSPAYVLAHFMRNNNVITRKHLIRVVLENEVEEFLCYASDYKDCLLETQKLMRAYLNIGNKLISVCRLIIDKISRADYALLVKALPKIYQGLLFYNYDHNATAEDYTSGWSENKWEEYLEAFETLKQEIIESD